MSPPLPPTLASDLESLLRDLEAAQRDLIALAADHRAAIARADAAAIAAIAHRQSEALDRAAALESRRHALINDFTRVGAPLPPPSRGERWGEGPSLDTSTPRHLDTSPPSTQHSPPTLTDLAHHLPDPARSRILDLAATVRDLARRAAADTRVVRAAAEAMLAHMDGLVRHVARALSHTGTYTHRGAIEPGPQVLSGLDLRR